MTAAHADVIAASAAQNVGEEADATAAEPTPTLDTSNQSQCVSKSPQRLTVAGYFNPP